MIAIPYGARILKMPPPGVNTEGLVEVVMSPRGSRAASNNWSYPDFLDLRDGGHAIGIEFSRAARIMIRQIAPQFFTTDIQATLDYYRDKLGFDCLGTWENPPVYAIVARDQHRINFRLAEAPTPNPDKYADELLDAYLDIDDADALYGEYAARGVEFTRGLANMPWHKREFVVKDCDGRLLAFGANVE